MLIEDTRSNVAEEVRRSQFIDSVNELASKLGAKTEGAQRPEEGASSDPRS
jgi:hypothetical protein